MPFGLLLRSVRDVVPPTTGLWPASDFLFACLPVFSGTPHPSVPRDPPPQSPTFAPSSSVGLVVFHIFRLFCSCQLEELGPKPLRLISKQSKASRQLLDKNTFYVLSSKGAIIFRLISKLIINSQKTKMNLKTTHQLTSLPLPLIGGLFGRMPVANIEYNSLILLRVWVSDHRTII